MYRLKCKIGALAGEARFTRIQERREMKEARRIEGKYAGLPPDAPPNDSAVIRRRRFNSMRSHRVKEIRPTTRTALLAYAFLRGKPYLLVERSCYRKPKWDEIEKEVLRYTMADVREVKQRFAEWKDAKETAVMKAMWKDQDAANAKRHQEFKQRSNEKHDAIVFG